MTSRRLTWFALATAVLVFACGPGRIRGDKPNLSRDPAHPALGDPDRPEIHLRPAVKVAAGDGFTCVVDPTPNHKSGCAGRNSEGELGQGNFLPVTAGVPLPVVGAVDVAAGKLHACALLANGGVSCWGRNQYGQLGVPSGPPAASPVPVSGLTGVTAIAAGVEQTCAIVRHLTSGTVGGQIKCWGNWDFSPSHVPEDVPGMSDATELACGDHYCCAIRANNEVWCFGGWYLLFSQGPGIEPKAIKVALPLAATAIGAGSTHACAVLSDGSVWCWGTNEGGQLGRPTVDTPFNLPSEDNAHQAPARVEGIADAFAVDGGFAHTCAIVRGGTVWCWGSNYFGQTAGFRDYRRMDPRPNPLRSTGPGSVSGVGLALALGAGHSCGIFVDHLETVRAVCWGQRTWEFGGNPPGVHDIGWYPLPPF